MNTLIQNKLNIKFKIKFKNKLANSEKVRTFAATYLPRFPSDQRAQGKSFFNDSFHHASHLNSEPGWNFCFKDMKYNKQPISIADQIAQLKSRGLIIEDENKAGEKRKSKGGLLEVAQMH